jgi:hypothetical protein
MNVEERIPSGSSTEEKVVQEEEVPVEEAPVEEEVEEEMAEEEKRCEAISMNDLWSTPEEAEEADDDDNEEESSMVYMSSSEEEEEVPDWPTEYGTFDTLRKRGRRVEEEQELEKDKLRAASNVERIEGLRQYLERQLGDKCLIESHRYLSGCKSFPLCIDSFAELTDILSRGDGDISRGDGDVEEPKDLVPLIRRVLVLEASMF